MLILGSVERRAIICEYRRARGHNLRDRDEVDDFGVVSRHDMHDLYEEDSISTPD